MEELTNFAAQLKQSELLSADDLRQLLRQFQSNGRQQGKRTADLTVEQLCDFLIQQEAITSWQAEKLQAGRFRGFFLGKYKLLDRLGAGGMSVVYLAENRVLGQKRAIKVLPKSRVENSSYLARFYKEARAAAALDHPNIVKTYDIDSEDDQHFMVMEFVPGEDLSQLVKRNGPLPIQQAIEFTRQAALALSHAHENQLIHRDIKPSNFMVTSTGQLKLMDLGLAKTNDDTASLTMMHNESLMGTADYLSPEQALNSHEVDHRTDIYSLGGTLYFMLAGHPPFPEGSIAQRLVKHQSIDPPSLNSVRTDCPAAIAELCQAMMKKKPEDRIASCDQVADFLANWQGKNPPAKSEAFVAGSTAEETSVAEKPAAEKNSAPTVPGAADNGKTSQATDVKPERISTKKPVPSQPVAATKPKSVPKPASGSPAEAVGSTEVTPIKDEPEKASQASLPKDAATVKAAPQVNGPKGLGGDKEPIAAPIIGHEAVDVHDVHLNLPETSPHKEHADAQSVDVGLAPHVAARAVAIKADPIARKPRKNSKPVKQRNKRKDALFLLSSLAILLILAAGFLIWAFVFQGSTPPPVVD